MGTSNSENAATLREIAAIIYNWEKERLKWEEHRKAAERKFPKASKEQKRPEVSEEDMSAVEKIITDGFQAMASEWDLLERVQGKLLGRDPDLLDDGSGIIAHPGIAWEKVQAFEHCPELIKDHIRYFAKEIVDGTLGVLRDYLALAKELGRWADELDKEVEADGIYPPNHVRLHGKDCDTFSPTQIKIIEYMWNRESAKKQSVAEFAWGGFAEDDAVRAMLSRMNRQLRTAGIHVQFHFRCGCVVKDQPIR